MNLVGDVCLFRESRAKKGINGLESECIISKTCRLKACKQQKGGPMASI